MTDHESQMLNMEGDQKGEGGIFEGARTYEEGGRKQTMGAKSTGSGDEESSNADRQALLRLFVKLFVGSLGLLQTIEGIKAGFKARRSRASKPFLSILHSILSIQSIHLRTSIFVSLYPILFRILNKIMPHTPLSTSSANNRKQDDQEFPEIFPSSFRFLLRLRRSQTLRKMINPALPLGLLGYLLPPQVLGQVNLYSVSIMGLAMARLVDKRVARTGLANTAVEESAQDKTLSTSPSQNLEPRSLIRRAGRTTYDALANGGGWWLFALSQGVLLHLAIFEPYAFSSSYRKAIIGRSNGYLPTKQSIKRLQTRARKTFATSLIPPIPTQTELLHLVPRFTRLPHPHPSFPAPIPLSNQYLPFAPILSLIPPPTPSLRTGRTRNNTHNKLFCATYHPTEVSCLGNYVKSVGGAIPSAFGFVGGWGALSLLAFGRRRLMDDPKGTLHKWLISTARGSAFMTLAITSAWAWICAFQRILRPDQLPRLRFALGGTLAGLWIILVPSARRLELGMYCLRLSMAGIWKVGTKKGWWRYRRATSILPFSLAMAALTALNREDKTLVHGWVARLLAWLDVDGRMKVEKVEHGVDYGEVVGEKA